MRWLEWVFSASFAVSVFGHIAVSEWAYLVVKKLDQDASVGTKFLSSYPKRMAFRYAAFFDNGTTTQNILMMALGVLWIPLALVVAFLGAIFFVFVEAYLKMTFYWGEWKYSRMTPEQKREQSITAEKKLLAMASEVRLSPHAMESNHPLDRSYREMMLTGESLALKTRERESGGRGPRAEANCGTHILQEIEQ